MALHRRAQINWVLCVALTCAAFALSVGALATSAPKPAESYDRVVSAPGFAFHLGAGVIFVSVLLSAYLDPDAMKIRYTVAGQPSYPQVDYDCRGLGRWTTFTVLSNTIGALYFCMAALHDGPLLMGLVEAPPQALRATLATVWEIVFPMSFLVNLVVTFVLIPAVKKVGALDKLDYVLRWRPMVLHNGFVLITSVEAVLVAPRILMQDWPVILLYGLTYVVFAWLVYLRVGVFHYFFLDPRYDHAPLGMVGLLILCSLLFCTAALVLSEAPRSPLTSTLILAVALSTCTWRAPSGPPEGIGTLSWLRRACGHSFSRLQDPLSAS